MAVSLADLLAAVQNGVVAINDLRQTLITEGSFPVTNTVAVTGLSTTSTQIIGADKTRKALLFHNPSQTSNLMVAPATDINGDTISPNFASPAGGYLVVATDYMLISGLAAQGAWTASVAASSVATTMTMGVF